jgi:alpha-tubulin suppressor-like RCC1 family protein
MKRLVSITAGVLAIGGFLACEESSDDGMPRSSNPKPGSGVHDGGDEDVSSKADGSTDAAADAGDAAVKGVSAVAVGSGMGTGSDGDHTCAIAGLTRSLYCWGANDRGQVGNGKTGNGTTAEDVSMPIRIATDETGQAFEEVAEIALAGWHSCARRSDVIHCWGQRFSGAQAEPPSAANPDRTKPRSIGGVFVKAIAAGGPHTCALRTNGKATCFGHSTFNELGRANPDDAACTAPFFVDYASSATHVCSGETLDVTSPLGPATALALGEVHSCALSGGKVLCWGTNTGGRLGEPLAGASELSAREVVTDPAAGTALDQATMIASGGGAHTCALRLGKVLCWGVNTYGELGFDPATLPQRPSAAAVPGLDGVQSIDAAYGLTCAVRGDGLWCWGNLFGPAGTRVPTSTPTQVKGPAGLGTLTGVVRAAVGKNHVCALRSDATVWCWGANDRGQLGDGTTTASEFPVKVKGLPE